MRPTKHPGVVPPRTEHTAGKGAARSTCWSVIVRAQGEGNDARRALGELIKRYESTVVTMVRAHGVPWNSSPEDLKQNFFLAMIERGDVDKLDQTRGRFRDWLRVAVQHFMINHWHAWLADKRGNRNTTPQVFQVMHGCTPELLFMRQFAEDTLLHALSRLRADSHDPARFDKLVRFLPGPQLDASELASLACAWGIPRNRLSVQIHFLRDKHKRILREIVADTLDVDVTDPQGMRAVELEMTTLYRLLCDVPRQRVMLEDA